MIQATATEETKLGLLMHTIVACEGPRRVVLFGSRARGEVRAGSDYDFYVEVDSEEAANELAAAIRRACSEKGLSADIIVASKKRFDDRRDDPGTVEWDVEREGVVLYSRPGVTGARVYERPPGTPSALEWVQRAEADYRLVERGVAAPEPDWEPICFLAHETVEKLLKGVIVSLGLRPLRSHDLDELLLQWPPEFGRNDVRAAVRLVHGVWPRTRYPGGPSVGREEGEAIVAATRLIRDIVGSLVREA